MAPGKRLIARRAREEMRSKSRTREKGGRGSGARRVAPRGRRRARVLKALGGALSGSARWKTRSRYVRAAVGDGGWGGGEGVVLLEQEGDKELRPL